MPPLPRGSVHVSGLRELDRAFKLVGNGLEKGLNEVLDAASEPVRSEAEFRARGLIKPPRSVDWAAMRVGVRSRVAWVAPVARGRASRSNPKIRRPKLKDRLLDHALEPALEANEEKVERELGSALDDLFRAWERV